MFTSPSFSFPASSKRYQSSSFVYVKQFFNTWLLYTKEKTMNKRIYRILSIILVLALTFGLHSTGQASSARAAVMPANVVNLAFFYKPPKNSTAAVVAQNFDAVILSRTDESFRDQLIANGFKSTIMQYLRFEAIMNPGSCTAAPLNNQVAYKPGDFCAISRDHPDWFLLDASGNRLTAGGSGDAYYMMDPGHPGWRAFWLARALEMQKSFGWTALFLDNVEANLGSRKNASGIPAKYPENTSYQAAIRGFLEYLYVNYAKAYNRPLFANIASYGKEQAVWFSYLSFLDGALMERWSVDWLSTGQYLDKATWEAEMAWAEKTQNLGKHIILVAPGNQTDTNRQRFGFASYLLISNGKAAFRYSNSGNYQQVWLYDNYQVDLGTPLGPRYLSGSLWRRDFTKGFVTVDPVNHTATISTNPVVASGPTATPVSTTQAVKSPTPLIPTVTPTTILPTKTPLQPTATFIPSTTPIGNPGSETIYDDKNAAFVYTLGWQKIVTKKAYGRSYKLTTRNGASVTFPFTGKSFSILYKSGRDFGKMEIYVDGNLVGILDQKAASLHRQRWDYPNQLAQGNHTLKLVFKPTSATLNRGSLDAVIVR
jgi:hypothetical protein